MPSAFILGTSVYLRSGVYLKLNLYATDSHQNLVLATLKKFKNHYST